MIRGNGRSEPAGKADAFQIGGVADVEFAPVTMRVISIGRAQQNFDHCVIPGTDVSADVMQ